MLGDVGVRDNDMALLLVPAVDLRVVIRDTLPCSIVIAIWGGDHSPDFLCQPNTDLAVVELVADVGPLVGPWVPHVHVAVLAEPDRCVLQQVVDGNLAFGGPRGAHVMVAQDGVLVGEPLAEGVDESLQHPHVAVVRPAVGIAPDGQPGIERVLVGRNKVAGLDDTPNAVAHPREERRFEHEVGVIRHLNVGDDDRIGIVDNGELIADR